MSDTKEDHRPDVLRTISEEELAKIEVLSPEKTHEALSRAQEDFRKCTQGHARFPRYR